MASTTVCSVQNVTRLCVHQLHAKVNLEIHNFWILHTGSISCPTMLHEFNFLYNILEVFGKAAVARQAHLDEFEERSMLHPFPFRSSHDLFSLPRSGKPSFSLGTGDLFSGEIPFFLECLAAVLTSALERTRSSERNASPPVDWSCRGGQHFCPYPLKRVVAIDHSFKL